MVAASPLLSLTKPINLSTSHSSFPCSQPLNLSITVNVSFGPSLLLPAHLPYHYLPPSLLLSVPFLTVIYPEGAGRARELLEEEVTNCAQELLNCQADPFVEDKVHSLQ